MTADRRDFLKASATSATALALGSLATPAPVRADEAPTPGTPHDTLRRLRRAQPVPLERIRITGGPLKRAQQLTFDYLLALDPDRMLAFYRQRAGLQPKAEPYGGWDGDGKNLTGHIAGHHLSGVSLMYAATGDARLKTRADYIVAELDVVQKANKDGYLGAIGGLREAFAKVSRGEIKSASFDLNGLWSPWYTLHKTFAGLRDAYRYTNNRRALQLEIGFATWAEGVLKPLTDAQVQSMLDTEFGGMNEVLVDLYADTGDTRWLTLSRRFEHHAVTQPMLRHQDNLAGKHGNCQIPKLIGSAARYGYTGDPDDLITSTFFWDRVVRHHSYASGGHGLNEYFGAPDKLSARVDGRAAETCNVYNMLKLTRMLFAFRPDASYSDFHERALFNHILASIDPTDGRTSYMVPVGRGEQQEYQDLQHDFTCCVGTGMESHGLHGHGVWYESSDTAWVTQFVPSVATLSLANARMTMETDFPDGGTATITMALPVPAEFTLMVRRPWWAGDGFRLAVNGADQPQPPLASLSNPVAGGRAGAPGNESYAPSSSFVALTRRWKTGDTITLTLPKTLRLEPTPDDPTVTAIMWGPLALAANHGPRRSDTNNNSQLTAEVEVPLLVTEQRDPAAFLQPTSATGDFKVVGAGRTWAGRAPVEMPLAPFHRTHRALYSVYFDLLSPGEFESRMRANAERQLAEQRLIERTVGVVTVGDAASEAAAKYQTDQPTRAIGKNEGRTQRSGTGWFSYELPVSDTAPMLLAVTYFVEPGLPAPLGPFDILLDGALLAHYVPDHTQSGFHRKTYEVPPAATRGKVVGTVRFQAVDAGRIAPVYEVRMVRR